MGKLFRADVEAELAEDQEVLDFARVSSESSDRTAPLLAHRLTLP
jgi:hypothetical protein